VPLPGAADALARASSISPHRMQLRERADGLIVIDDAYNANPDSMRAALEALARIGSGGRRVWAVLGPMRELGNESPALHARVGAAAAGLGVDEIVVVGNDARPIADGAADVAGWGGRARIVNDVAAATAVLRAELRHDDAVLVKASNSERLWQVADALTATSKAIA
jgi:UDP-N-acetylmuramoyl-tripeptide--D-alanyl-D-alanine ligase